MPLSADNFVQSKPGGHDGAAAIVLDNPTTAGNRVIVSIGSSAALTTPSGWTKHSAVTTTFAGIYSKPAVDGETSVGTFGAAGSTNEWDAFEMSGLDPDAPVDVVAASHATDGTTGSTGPSTTYDGLFIGLHRAAATSAVPAFGGHSAGYEELSDHGHLNGTTGLSVSTCRRFVQSLGTWVCDCDPDVGTSLGVGVLFTAEGAKREPTISHFWSFPAELAGAAGLTLGPTGAKYFEFFTGSPVITADGLRLTGTASSQRVSAATITTLASLRAAVGRVRFRLESLPSADLVLALQGGTDGWTLSYQAASGKLAVQLGSGAVQLSDQTISAGQWVSVDVRVIGYGATGTSRRGSWQIDYGSGPVVQADPPEFTSATTLSNANATCGWLTALTGDVTYDYAIYSNVAGHYPLGDFIFPFLKPDTAGTITARTGTTADLRRFTANGTIAGSFNSADIIAALRDWPPVFGASADGAAIVAASTGTYTIPMETYSASGTGSIRTVQVLAALWAASATTCTHQMDGHDGSASTTLLAMADQGTDTGSTPPWLAKLWQPSGGWTQAKLDAATIDLLSDDATPDPGWHCLAMIAAVQPAETQALFGTMATQALDPVTGGVLGVTVDTTVEPGKTADLTYEEAGTPTTVNVPADTTQTEAIDAPDAPTVNRIELQPE